MPELDISKFELLPSKDEAVYNEEEEFEDDDEDEEWEDEEVCYI
jgi:hypothetical protein